MKRTIIFLGLLLAIAHPSALHAQHWAKVVQLTTNGASAYFFNANEGVIGTGSYQTGSALKLYYTNDAGKTWTLATLPNMNLFGQVTDIFFTDRLNGWATLKESNEHGWSGLYRSIDGGASWSLRSQLDFPVAVRETSTGVFVSDRFYGLRLSTDGGRTFRIVGSSNGSLGLDFLPTQSGYLSAEGSATSPHLRSTDGGLSWPAATPQVEAWGVFADPAKQAYYVCSEKDFAGVPTQSAILRSIDLGATFKQVWSGAPEQISGGIAGWRGCTSTVYAQGGQGKLANGVMRTSDDGQTWKFVGGPNNFDDKRFAVTGRGAVVYVFDQSGGVWKTSDGGDGTLSPNIMRFVTIQPSGSSIVTASICDSVTAITLFSINTCDSAHIVRIVALDDALSETSFDLALDHYFSRQQFDSLKIVYRPQDLQTKTLHYRLTIAQPDGYLEDTVISQTFQGRPSKAHLVITTNGAPRSLDFGQENICSGDSVSEITLSNTGCASTNITRLNIAGADFSLRSKFAAVTLDPGNQRTYLVGFKPRTLGLLNGALIVSSTLGIDTIDLSGFGIPGKTGIAFTQPQIVANLCDSTEQTIAIHNTSCSALAIDSIALPAPFTILNFRTTSLPSDSTLEISVRFVPRNGGLVLVSVFVHAHAGVDAFDTILTLSAWGVDHGPSLVMSVDTIDLGKLPICSNASGSVILTNSGCDALSVDSISIAAPLTLLSSGRLVLARRESDTVTVRFDPLKVGIQSYDIFIHTNAGIRRVTVLVDVTSDAGQVALSVIDTATLSCQSSAFVVTLRNSTCDSITIDSASIIGANAADFTLAPIPIRAIGVGQSVVLTGTFTPTGGGLRTASAEFHIRRRDGSNLDTAIAIQAQGIASPPVRISLPDSSMVESAGNQILIPLYALDSSVVTTDEFSATLAFNSDLLTPLRFDPVQSALLAGTTTVFDQTRNGVLGIVFTLPKSIRISKGLLGWITFDVKLTDTIQTDIDLNSAALTSKTYSPACLSALKLGSVIHFALDPLCGDRTIVGSMSKKLALSIAAISPNPASDGVTIIVKGSSDEQIGRLEISDALGHLLQSEELHLTKGATESIVRLKLSGASGIRYARLISNEGISTRRFILQH